MLIARNPNYSLANIDGKLLLLPLGQAIADRHLNISINETVQIFWERLDSPKEEASFYAELAALFGVEDRSDFYQDMQDLTDMLVGQGALLRGVRSGEAACRYTIAGMHFAFCSPLEYLVGSKGNPFDAFLDPKSEGTLDSSESESADATMTNADCQTIRVTFAYPSSRPTGQLILQDPQLIIVDAGAEYVLYYPTLEHFAQLRLSKDGLQVHIWAKGARDEFYYEELFHVLRIPFLYLAQKHHCLVLHSASVCYRDRAWLFSGPSGTGKSTHGKLWVAKGYSWLNGDLNLITLRKDGTPMVKGIPWCGTSGLYSSTEIPLGGITLLKQAPQNRAARLNPSDATVQILQRLISPFWTEEQLKTNLAIVEQIVKHIYTGSLECTPDPAAQQVLQESIDAYLSALT